EIAVVHLNDRRIDASAEAFDLEQRELLVRRGLADADTELLLASGDDLVRAPEPARRRRADLKEMASHRPQIEHRVEARDLVDLDRRHRENFRDEIHRRARYPPVMLFLREI